MTPPTMTPAEIFSRVKSTNLWLKDYEYKHLPRRQEIVLEDGTRLRYRTFKFQTIPAFKLNNPCIPS